MNKHLLRTLFLSIMMVFGAMGAWAAEGDVTTNADINFSNAITGTSPYTIDGTVGKMTWTNQWTFAPTIVDGILRFGNTSGQEVVLENNNIRSKDQVTISFDMAFGKLNNKHVGFKLVDADNNDLLVQWFDAYNGDFDDANPLNLSWDKMYHGNNVVIQERCVNFTIVFNYATKKVTTTTSCLMSGAGKPATAGEFEADWTVTAPIAKFVLQGNINNADRYSTLDNLKITTTEGNYSAATANYTVKYVCGNEEIKDAATYVGDVDAPATIASSDKANTYGADENSRYIYVSDDAEGKTIAEDGSTVVTVTFREAEKWDYSINSAYGSTTLDFSATGSVWEDLNTVSVQYPRFQTIDNQLVQRAPVNNSLKTNITVESNNFTHTLEYVAVDPAIDNLYLLKEAEDLETTLPSSATSFSDRVSGGKIIYGGSGVLLTLPAGKYIFTLGAIGGDNNSHKVTYTVSAGETQIISDFVVTGNMLSLRASDEFTLNEETSISFTCSDPSSARGIDLVYVQKTGDVEPVATITDGFYIFGTMNSWAAQADYMLTSNPANSSEYMITLNLNANDAFKVVKVEGSNTTWYPDGNNNDYVITEAGEYTIYFRPDYQGGDDWYYGCIYAAKAAEPGPTYTVDFNTAIATSAKDFAVASNWAHVSGYDAAYDSNMSYSWSETAGVDKTGALLAYRQYKYDWGQSSSGVEVYDLLITPQVKGTVSIDVKQYSGSNSYIEFYAMTDNGDGTFTRGDLIPYTKDAEAEFSQSAYVTVSINVADFARIGIRASYMYLDNFTAQEANIIPEKAITIASADPTATTGTIFWDQQADGTVLVKYTVTVKNTGDVDLTQGMDGYSVSIFNRDDNTVYVTTPVPQDLAVGATSEPFVVQASVDASVWPNSYSYHSMDLKENLKGSVLQRAQSHYKAYQSKFIFRAAESTATSSITAAETWGTITESTTKSFEIYNDGLAPLTIKSITLPEGFTSDNAPEIPSEGLVLNGKAKVTFNVTQDAASYGTFAGDLAVEYLNYGSEETTTYTLAFSATIINANTWRADFNNPEDTAPIYPVGAIAEGGISSGSSYSNGQYDVYLMGRTSSSYVSENNKFITPKLHANAGDKLAYDVKGVYNYNNTYYAKVYVSTDRVNWGEPVAYFTYSAKDGAEAISSANWYNRTVEFAEAGDYYVAFALYGEFKIDNLVGLEKCDVAHDLYIKEVSWTDASIKSNASQTKPIVKVIPLTDETAEAYTVKYVCGETVLAEGTPVALTASASSTTDFSFAWTPQVESTTDFPATKVVFEFTDGTKFETETFDLTVTNEAVFHFLNSKPSSKWYEPTDYTTPIAFGKTNTADTQMFVIFNWGSVDLTVNSISLPDGFTTTTEFPLTVAAFNGENDGIDASCQTLDITFSAAEAGTFGGDMVITYSGDQTFTLAVSGTKLDPSKFYANFDDGGWPAGSVYQNNIGSSNGGSYSAPNYYITSSSTTDNIFVTPKLTAAAGEKLLFDAKLYSSYWSEGAVKVYAATTREEVLNAEEGTTRELLFYASGEDTEANAAITTDYQTFEVPALAGDYFYGFEISGRPYVDELCGLAPVAVAHDLMLVSSDIPGEGMANYPLTATVNVLNLGLQDETEYDIYVHVGDEVKTVAGTEPITMKHKLSESTAISVPVQTAKAGTYSVFIEVKAGDYTIATDPVEVTFAEEVPSASADMAANGTTGNAPLNLNYKNSESLTLYNAETLAGIGLGNGSKISSITFKGYKTTDVQTTSFQVYYKWTDDQTIAQPTSDYPYAAEAADMTMLIDEDHTWNKVGSSTELDDMIVLDFGETPLVYEAGKSLCIYMHSYVDDYKAAYFEKSTLSKDFCYVRYQDAATMSKSWSKETPAAVHFALVAESATISGTVKDAEGAPIENATITLVSADDAGVQYSGTTDAEGAYNFNVVQANRQYLATVTAEGYADKKTNVSFADGDVVKNFTMKAPALKNIFLKPGVWAQDDARFAAYVWYEGWTEWIDFTPAMEDGIYTFTTSTPYDGLILVRLNPTTAENNWDNKWNQSSDIDFTAVADSTLFVIDGWNASEFHTEKYSVEEAPVYAKGDVNMDGDVNTSDAVLVVNVAIEKATLTDEQFALADINESNTITVADAVGIVNIALGLSASEPSARVFGTNDFLSLNGQQLSLTNTTSFVAFQMDVTLANGASFNGIELSQRASGLQVVTNQIGYNTWRIVAFSLNNTTITGNQGNLLRINANGEININNVEFADAAANAYELGFGDATGINEIEDGKLKIENAYNLGGQKLQKAHKGLNIINGRKVVVK